MGVPIYSLNDFETKLVKLKAKRKLLGFFLFDSRPSFQAIERFTLEQQHWLDELAGFSGIYFFFPLKETDSNNFENPSLNVAKLFDIKPNQLPGILLFSMHPEKSEDSKNAVYFPLDPGLFTEDQLRIEKVFNELFVVIKQCQRADKTPDELLDAVRMEVEKMRSSPTLRLFAKYLKKGASVLFLELPANFVKAFAEGAAKGWSEKLTKG